MVKGILTTKTLVTLQCDRIEPTQVASGKEIRMKFSEVSKEKEGDKIVQAIHQLLDVKR